MNRSRLLRAALAAAVLMVTVVAPAPAAEEGWPWARAVLRYTEHGIPHITARSFDGLGYGVGYAQAKDNLCVLADGYLTVRGERSRYLGPAAPANPGLVTAANSLTSDLYFRRLRNSGVVERLLREPAPSGPRSEVAALVRGFTEGYNRHLRDIGPNGITDPACRGAQWVRPITELDVYTHAYALATISGTGSVADAVVDAVPPADVAQPRADTDAAARMASAFGGSGLGSNAIAAGAEGTTAGKSVLLGNPHYPWQGVRRFWQFHLTVPGRIDVAGAGLLGLPLVMIGHNADVAWSHTVSTAVTFGLYETKTVPGAPTEYVVDGKPEAMSAQTVTVDVRDPGGSISQVTRTFYSTRYGPVVVGGPGGAALPWGATAHSLRDANADNLRLLNTWIGFATAGDTARLERVLAENQAVPWLNTVAADRHGNAMYANVQVTPNVTDQLVATCATPLGKQVYPISGLSVLDGGRAECAWRTDADAIRPGLIGPSSLPKLTRRDWVGNFNDSPWLTNPSAPITGYPRGVGNIGTPRSLRTQQGIHSAQRRIAGADGLPGKGFSLETMREVLLAGAARSAELARADTAAMCASFPGGVAPSAQGPVDVSAACGVLAAWDGKFTPAAQGAALFGRFVARLGAVAGGPWTVPFDPADPVGTPRGLATANPAVRQAFGDAARDLLGAGHRIDVPLREFQSVTRAGERIPVPGAAHQTGVLNVVTPLWDSRQGNTDVVHGSSFIQVVEFGADRYPRVSTLLTYSQSSDPTSPYHADQTRLFAEGRWVTGRFRLTDVLSSPSLRTKILW